MPTKKPASRKAAGNKVTAKSVTSVARKPPSVVQSARVPFEGDFEKQILTIYSMSKEQAAQTVRRSGVLTPKGKLSASYK